MPEAGEWEGNGLLPVLQVLGPKPHTVTNDSFQVVPVEDTDGSQITELQPYQKL